MNVIFSFYIHYYNNEETEFLTFYSNIESKKSSI